MGQEIDHNHDVVQRGAHLVAHDSEEVTLELGRALGGLCHNPQLVVFLQPLHLVPRRLLRREADVTRLHRFCCLPRLHHGKAQLQSLTHFVRIAKFPGANSTQVQRLYMTVWSVYDTANDSDR
jgi:hypothetical protein